MLSLAYSIDDDFSINGRVYTAHASFDVVLAIIDLLSDKRIHDYSKLIIAITNFFGEDTDLLELDPNDLMAVFNNVFSHYTKPKEKPKKFDDLGNEIPVIPEYDEDEKKSYSLKHDAEYIFASFVQAYNMDLVEQQGKLHWFKFQALLNGLPEDTIFKQIVSIRQWKKPSKNEKEETRMRKLQEIYALPQEREEG